jgi:hypothetical protein
MGRRNRSGLAGFREIPTGSADHAFLEDLILQASTQLFVKEVKVEGKRYIVCRNEAEAEKDRKDREAIVTALDAQLKRGDKALVGNSAYRRYLRKTADGPAFAIDAGKLAEEARFDGIFVLRCSSGCLIQISPGATCGPARS